MQDEMKKKLSPKIIQNLSPKKYIFLPKMYHHSVISIWIH
jgi:hypothetical protein